MCVGANQGCVDRMVGGLPITCFHNPDVGREERGEPAPVEVARRVLVVGGGPAGLKAAEVAARRGHTVTLVEREDELGGRLRYVRRLGSCGRALPLGRLAPRRARRARRRRAARPGGGRRGDRRRRRGRARDGLASGSRPARREVDGSIPVLSLDECVDGDPPTGRLLFVDARGDLETALTAEHLAAAGAELTLVTPALHVAPARRLHAREGRPPPASTSSACRSSPARCSTGSRAARRARGTSTRARCDSGPFDAIVAGVHGRSETALADDRRAGRDPAPLAGDAVAPRSALHAFREGADAGRAA